MCVFRAPNEDLEAKFVAEATKRGSMGSRGTAQWAACCASIYNAFPRQGVLALVNFMKEFEMANRAAVPA
jgi:phosphoserine aminotransferase